MVEHTYFKFSNSVVVAPLLAVITIWSVYWIELRFQMNLNDYGIYPRTVQGIRGIIFSPFIHASLDHLYNNTIPLAVLMASLFYFYRNIAVRTLLLGVFLSGLLTWVIGRPSYHIGASGVIYFLASFIFFKGMSTRYYRLVALSLMVVFIYGSLLWYIFPVKEGISWEGHLAGFFMGLVLAYVLKTPVPSSKKFAWEHDDYNEEEDEFLRHFDENGNFIEAPKELEEEPIRYTYQYKDNTEE